MSRTALAAASLLLATLASAEPPRGIPSGTGWFCPSAKVRGLQLQCQRTAKDCADLVATGNANTGQPDPPCNPRPRAYCHSFRPRGGGDHYLPPEAYCFEKLADCRASRRDAMGFGARYIDHSACAPAP